MGLGTGSHRSCLSLAFVTYRPCAMALTLLKTVLDHGHYCKETAWLSIGSS